VRIADGVWEIRLSYVHAHLIADDRGVALVDTGLPGKVDKLCAAIEATGNKVEQLHTILLTHHHADHIGSVADLRARTGATVVAHVLDTPTVDGTEPFSVPHPLLRFAVPIMGGRPKNARVDIQLTEDGPTPVAGVVALHTPGHTLGHVSYLLNRDGGVLFAGDAATTRFGKLRQPPKFVSEDVVDAENSIRRLATLDFNIAVFGHGRHMRGRAIDRFRAYALL
jgi:glyoxylase-like metal-dependent hydrolase (beta-lactamase superfamily II)